MAPDAIGVGTLRQLAELPTGGHPVLSVYFDLESESLSTPAARDAHLGSLRREPELSGARTAVDSVQALLRTRPELTRGAHGLAVFSCNEAGVLEAVRLPQAVKPMAVLDTLPWLEPLAELTTCENWGVAVVSPHRARLFRGGVRALTEFAAFDAQGRSARTCNGSPSGCCAPISGVRSRNWRSSLPHSFFACSTPASTSGSRPPALRSSTPNLKVRRLSSLRACWRR